MADVKRRPSPAGSKNRHNQHNNQAQQRQDELSSLDEQSKRILAVRKIMKDREIARQSGNYIQSDLLRQLLSKTMDVSVIDQKDGPSGWKFNDGSSNKLKAGTKIPEDLQKKRSSNNEGGTAVSASSSSSSSSSQSAGSQKQKQRQQQQQQSDRNKHKQ